MASQHVSELTSAHAPAMRADGAHVAEHRASLAALAPAAWGAAIRRMGTSALYTFKECLHAGGGGKGSVEDVFGILSLMFWALILVVTVKYLMFIMRADHQGEGGIFALLAIVPERFRIHAAQTGKVTGMALL